jgi:hypothetical protein
MGSTTVKGTTLIFAVNENTRVVVRGGSSELSDVAVGDPVAVGIAAGEGATLAELLATPVEVLRDLKRKASTSDASSAATAARQAKAVAR